MSHDLLLPCITSSQEDGTVLLSQVLYLSLAYFKKVPKIVLHTKDDEFISKITGSLESLEIMLGQFGFIRVDSGALASIHHFDRFEKDGYSQYYCFRQSDKRLICSRAGYAKAKAAIDQTL